MALKKKKGYRIETKTLKSKLIRQGDFVENTVQVYRESIEFYIQVINQHPSGVDLDRDKQRDFYDALTMSEDAKYPFIYSDMPRDLRWDVIGTAVGHYKSWRSNHQKWLVSETKRKEKAIKKGKIHKPHLEPKLPTEVHDSPTYYKYSMYKEDTGFDVLLKVRVGNGWGWVKFSYFAYSFDNNWIKGCPTIVFKKDGSCWINWTLERYHIATGGVKAQQDKRVCAVDIDLDGDSICTLSVLEPDVNGEVKEVARTFIKGHNSHVRRRKSAIGRIAKKMNQTGTVFKGFCSKHWLHISNSEKSEGYRISSQIVKFAVLHHCKVIVFEHLGSLRPQKGKYSKRSNQKRAYWLKSKIYKFTHHIARTKHNILSARVNPKDTSKYSAFTGETLFRTNYDFTAFLVRKTEASWDYYMKLEGYHPGKLAITRSGYSVHSGLNAARNIGMRFYQRYSNAKLVLVKG